MCQESGILESHLERVWKVVMSVTRVLPILWAELQLWPWVTPPLKPHNVWLHVPPLQCLGNLQAFIFSFMTRPAWRADEFWAAIPIGQTYITVGVYCLVLYLHHSSGSRAQFSSAGSDRNIFRNKLLSANRRSLKKKNQCHDIALQFVCSADFPLHPSGRILGCNSSLAELGMLARLTWWTCLLMRVGMR